MIALALAIFMVTPLALSEDDEVIFDPTEEFEFADVLTDDYLIESREHVNKMRHILLIGIDARPGEKTGRSDTMIIVTVDPNGNIIKLTSLMRDLYVEIPGHKNNRINAAYVFGGADLLMQTIERNFGIHIEKYIAVNFSMLGKLIDSIGGLTLTVDSDYYMDRINAIIRQDNMVLGINEKDGFLTGSGEQLMTGKQAQAYARYRYGTPDGDFGRTGRQREVIIKIFQKLCTKSVVELMGLVALNLDSVYTNLSVSELVSFAPVMLSMTDANMLELCLPVDGAFKHKTISGMAVIVPDREKNMRALLEFLGNN